MTKKKTYNNTIFTPQTLMETMKILKKKSSFWHGGSFYFMHLEALGEEQTYDDVDAFLSKYSKGFDSAYISLEYASRLSFISFTVSSRHTIVTVSHTNRGTIQEIFALLDSAVQQPKMEPAKSLSPQPAQQNSDFVWDAFICHASEDKDEFVRRLAKDLESRKLKVWYDEFALKVGDSLRQSIDRGLVDSKYGIVVLSRNFFTKKWPQDELNGLTVRERNGTKVILPVWLNVDGNYISEYSPILADRLAANYSLGFDKVVADLLKVIKQQ